MIKKIILLLPTYFPTKQTPLAGTQVLEQTELVKSNYDIKVLYCVRQNITQKRYYYEKLKSLLGVDTNVSCSDVVLSGSLENRGSYYNHVSGFSEEKNFLLCLKAYKAHVAKLMDEDWKPDLIHARTAEHAGLIAYHLSEQFSIPFIITENCALLFDSTFSVFKFKSYFKAISNAKTVAFVSNYLMKLVLMHGVKCNHYIIGNLIDEYKFKIAEEHEKISESFRILTIGYNSYIKDFETFFNAIGYIIKQGHKDIAVDIVITFYWSEKNKEELIQMAQDRRVLEYCNFYYQVPRNEINRFFHKTDVFISTSITETFGISCCEAMLCGKPVVATANGGIDDFISADNGVKVQLKDYEAIGENVIKIKKKELKFDPYIVRDSIVQRYGREAFKKKLCLLYASVFETA